VEEPMSRPTTGYGRGTGGWVRATLSGESPGKPGADDGNRIRVFSLGSCFPVPIIWARRGGDNPSIGAGSAGIGSA
jgi:hypothetical protein